MKSIHRRGPLSIEQTLDWMEQLRADAERKAITDLLVREQDFDDWDQVLATIDAYREATKDWRKEMRLKLEAELREVHAWRALSGRVDG